jgi:hypothetical protein
MMTDGNRIYEWIGLNWRRIETLGAVLNTVLDIYVEACIFTS